MVEDTIKNPDYVTKQNCLLHFLKIFNLCDIYIFADNVDENTYQFLKNNVDSTKIIRTCLIGSFMYSLDFAIQHFNENESVYFAEDDYIYTKDAPKVIEEGLDIASRLFIRI